MSNGVEHPFGDRDPRSLTEGEYRLLTDSRLKTLETRLDGIYTVGRLILVAVLGGVLLFWLTGGGPG